MDSKEPVVGLDKKIPFAEKLLFPATGGIAAFLNSMLQFYLTFYYVSVLQMNFVYIAPMFLVVQLIAAAAAPLVGAFIDRRTTRWGTYKPWIFIILTGTAVGAALVFMPVNFGPTGNLVYATVAYTVFSLFMSMNMAAGIGMTAAMTKRQDDRLTIAISGHIWVTVGSLVFSYATQPLVNMSGIGNQTNGFPYFMLLCLIVTVVLTLLITRTLKERFVIPPEKQTKFSVRLMAQTLFKNKYALTAIACGFLLSLCAGLKTVMAVRYSIFYFREYYFQDTGMTMIFTALGVVPVIIGILLSPIVTKKLGLKRNLLMMVIVNIVTSAAVFFVPTTPSGIIALYVLLGIGYLFIGLARPAQETMLPFAADYSAWKFSTNSGGFLGGLSSLTQTSSTVLIGALPAWILVLFGYTSGGEPSAVALFGIRASASIIPAILFALLALVVTRWDMTPARQMEIANEIYARQAADTGEAAL